MNLLYSGEIGLKQTWHYALFDAEETITNDEIFSRMLLLADGVVLSFLEKGVGDNDIVQVVPNIWVNDGAAAVGGLAFMPDAGLAFSPAEFNGSAKIINGNGIFKTNSYGKLHVSSQASLFLNTNPTGRDISGTVTTRVFHNGHVLVHAVPDNTAKVMALFLTSGLVYVWHDFQSASLPFGYFVEQEVLFNLIAYLDPMRLYCIQSVPNVAHGTVYDAAKKPAAHCKVLAYQRSSGKLVGQTTSTSDGTYRCPILTAKGDEIFMVCLDNDAAPDFEARIIDRITV